MLNSNLVIFDRLEFPCITDENRANPLTNGSRLVQ